MDPAAPLVIHNVLSNEIMGMIFEEHAALRWKAPIIDGQVCRLWRQIVFNTPRAWGYLEIGEICKWRKNPSTAELRSWLDRSGTTSLHIRVDQDSTLDEGINGRKLYDLLSDYHTRIASLRMASGDFSFFGGRDFPRLWLLEVNKWGPSHSSLSPIRWGPMPGLRSLHLGNTNHPVVPFDEISPLNILILYKTNCTSLQRHSASLTTLMLEGISFHGADAFSDPLDFPSLTYLSLFDVYGLKEYIVAPNLITFHQGGWTLRERFREPQRFLVEYGTFGLDIFYADPSELYHEVPYISTISIRAEPPDLISWLRSLSNSYVLRDLETISVGPQKRYAKFTKEERETMESLVLARSYDCERDIELCVEDGLQLEVPLFFAEVSHRPSDDL
jgi:hypothetical protein